MESIKTKSFWGKVLALVLILAMALVTPAQAFAASNNYIKDVKMVYASNATDAGRLAGKGYSVLSTPIYTSEKKDQSGNNYHMYVAYQTTTNPEEAITDIRAMNMNGGWSYEKYAEYLQKQKEDIELMLSDLVIAITEFRANYAAGKDTAIYAYNILQKYVEDDSEMLLGDFLLNKALEDHDQLVTLTLQSSTDVIVLIDNALMIACQGTLNGTFAQRLSAADVYQYADSKEYLGASKVIVSGLEELQNAVRAYENSGYVSGVQDDEEINAWIAGASQENIKAWTEGNHLYELLKSTPYQGMDNEQNLYDLFMNHTTYTDANGNVVAEFQPNVFNAAAAMMSDGQKAMLKIVGLKGFLLKEGEEGSYSSCSSIVNTLGILDEITEPISVYEGIDRSVFDAEGIAMTSAAMQQIAAGSETAWAQKSVRQDVKNAMLVTMAVAGGIAAIATTVVLLQVKAALATATTQFMTTAVTKAFGDLVGAGMIEELGVAAAYEGAIVTGQISAGGTPTFLSTLLPTIKASGFLTALSAVAIIGIGIMLIAFCVWLIVTLIEDTTPPEWESIPRKIMNEVEMDGENQYIYYDGVRQASRDSNTGEELNDGQFMDIGNWEDDSRYRQWVAVYTTKDPKAGKPILAKGFSITTEPNTNVGFLQLKKFNETTPYNLTTYCSTAKTYINYKVDTRYNPAVTASVFGSNMALAFGGGGLLLGLAGGLFLGVKSGKKKKANA